MLRGPALRPRGPGPRRSRVARMIANSSPPSRDAVACASGRFQPDRRFSQQLVAELVAVGVVHLLEVVEVDEQETHVCLRGLRGAQSRIDVLAEADSIE